MSTKMSILGLGFAAAVLAGCGNSGPPPPKAKPAASPVASFEAKSVSAPEERKADANTPEEKPFEGYVGVAPPGKVAFGPAALGQDPQRDAELQQIRDKLAKSNNVQQSSAPPNGGNKH